LFEVCRFHFSLFTTGPAVFVYITITATTFNFPKTLTSGAPPQTFTGVPFSRSLVGSGTFHFVATSSHYPTLTVSPTGGVVIDRFNMCVVSAVLCNFQSLQLRFYIFYRYQPGTCIDAGADSNPLYLTPGRLYTFDAGSYSDTTANATVYMSTETETWDWAAGPLSFNLAAGTHRFFEVDLSRFDNTPSRQLKVEMDLTSTVGPRASVGVSVGRYRNLAGMPYPVVSFITSEYEIPSKVVLFAGNDSKSSEIHSRFYDSPKRKMYITVRHDAPALDNIQADVQLVLRVSYYPVTPASVGAVILSPGGPNMNVDPYKYYRIDTPNLLSYVASMILI
jgi:hypothetical protein